MILLFEASLRDDTMEELLEIAEEEAGAPPDPAVVTLVNGTLEHLEELDAIISAYSPKRALSRIPKLLLAILRIALYEIRYDSSMPTNAAISEAVLLTEEFSYFEEDTRFVNGLLGKYARDAASVDSTESAP